MWNDTFTTLLHRIIVSENINDTLTELTAQPWVSLIELPSWIWVIPRTNLGQNRSQRLQPARVTWNTGRHLHTLTHKETLTWEAHGVGHHSHGETTIQPVDSSTSPTGASQDNNQPLPHHVAVTKTTPTTLKNALNTLQTSGDHARWLALEYLSGSVHEAVDRARYAVSYQVGLNGAPLFDDHTLERVTTELLYGQDGRTTSAIIRLINRSLHPDAFTKSDPAHTIKRAIYRDATDATRRTIAEPAVGTKIRAIAQELDTTNIDHIVATYRERHPQDRVSALRVQHALQAQREAGVEFAAEPSLETLVETYRFKIDPTADDSWENEGGHQ